jgi:adenylate cyclase
MPEHSPVQDPEIEKMWLEMLVSGDITKERRMRSLFRRLPREPRCKNCLAPFSGIGARLVKMVYGKQPSRLNPRMCNICDEFASRHQGGAEVDIAMLFADVRGSTSLAEEMSVAEFHALIDRFYQATTQVLVETDALIDKLIGDEVSGIYVPGYAGPQYASRAVEAAHKILHATGHADPDGPWIPVGVGIHTGRAYVGAVGSPDGMVDITALGDAPNTAARLASNARPGEILVSQATYQAAGLDGQAAEQRSLQLKGRSQPVEVYVLHP